MPHLLPVAKMIPILNDIANRPDILPHVAPGYENVDMAAFFDNPDNVMIGNLGGVILFGSRGDGVYEAHYLLGEEYRGKAAKDAARKALHIMFTEYNAKTIIGETPAAEKAARHLNHALGFTPIGDSVLPDGRPCVVYELERSQWEHLLAESSAA